MTNDNERDDLADGASEPSGTTQRAPEQAARTPYVRQRPAHRSVEPIDGIEEEPAPEVPAHTMDLTKSDLINAHFADGSVGLETGGEMMTEEWTLFPGRYRVTLTGSGFDHSYIYARYGLINQETYKLDIDFTGIDPSEMTFEFTATEMLHYWRTAVHTLDDANVTVNSVTVEKVG